MSYQRRYPLLRFEPGINAKELGFPEENILANLYEVQTPLGKLRLLFPYLKNFTRVRQQISPFTLDTYVDEEIKKRQH